MAPLIKISLHLDHYQTMLAHVMATYPREACGLLGGVLIDGTGSTRMVISIPNILKSDTRFRMEPQKQIDALLTFQHSQLDLLAIYHSHPAGPTQPSETDLEEFNYPESASIIWSIQVERWNCQAYRYFKSSFTEIPIVVDK